MRSFLIVAILMFFVEVAFAAGDGIPVKMVLVQIGNFAATITLLIFIIRKPLAAYFKQKYENFHVQAKRAEKEKKRAQAEKEKVISLISELKNRAISDKQKAIEESENLKNKMLSQGREFSEKIREDVEAQLVLEREKKIQQLKEGLLEEAVEMASERLKNKVSENDLRRLGKEFVQNIQVVN